MRPPLTPGSHVLLILPEPSGALPPESAQGPAGELILEGRRYHLVPAPTEAPTTPPASGLLTTRELQIVSLVAAGRVNKEIASALSISVWTVSAHLRRIFAKLGVDTRAAMVSRCFGSTPERR
ncbi:LuxR C-terminal-related transcriptional regulator [Vitiosangium sp. GDMCC 1.1324]|uniref:helix-turn-helix transcriptional regulator n=1 Tax=Vitiosangium sp. (strain GDMCC 1.1324) TaxID=2138576 RepID=UPI000D382914|nr:LuxR C-terminal-related transcriptional regulator [Vitiosangium sp. GDMCC 1.1324]PTL81220.1 helix-turn-helix transcriptional regulator [Vitiosangium sp. GDMCC 1.1324]